MRRADSLRPEDRVDARGARDGDADDEVFGDWGVEDEEEDVAEEGDGFDFWVRVADVSWLCFVVVGELRWWVRNLLIIAATQGETSLRWMSQPMSTRQVQPKAYVG
jgi:hypothetical protein